MGLIIRPSRPALEAIGRVIRTNRCRLIDRWMDWVFERVAHPPDTHREILEREITLLVDIMIELAGPLRRQVLEVWYSACDVFGHVAATRGLAAGEVVEEIQHLRELLIRTVSEPIANLPARQAMAAVLRLNRMMDKGITYAVVGYTDSLVELLFNQRGVPISASVPEFEELDRRLEQLKDDLRGIRIKQG